MRQSPATSAAVSSMNAIARPRAPAYHWPSPGKNKDRTTPSHGSRFAPASTTGSGVATSVLTLEAPAFAPLPAELRLQRPAERTIGILHEPNGRPRQRNLDVIAG